MKSCAAGLHPTATKKKNGPKIGPFHGTAALLGVDGRRDFHGDFDGRDDGNFGFHGDGGFR